MGGREAGSQRETVVHPATNGINPTKRATAGAPLRVCVKFVAYPKQKTGGERGAFHKAGFTYR